MRSRHSAAPAARSPAAASRTSWRPIRNWFAFWAVAGLDKPRLIVTGLAWAEAHLTRSLAQLLPTEQPEASVRSAADARGSAGFSDAAFATVATRSSWQFSPLFLQMQGKFVAASNLILYPKVRYTSFHISASVCSPSSFDDDAACFSYVSGGLPPSVLLATPALIPPAKGRHPKETSFGRFSFFGSDFILSILRDSRL